MSFNYLTRWFRFFSISICIFTESACSYISNVQDQDEFLGVGLYGAQHMGPNYNIMVFYLNETWGSNVGRGGGGGGEVCCVMLPVKWRPGLKVQIRWTVGDWSQEIVSETNVGNYKSIKVEGRYIATVPVEKYDEIGDVYVHFFSGGKVRVVSSNYSVLSSEHPILRNVSDAGSLATTGIRVNQLFKDLELDKKLENKGSNNELR
jgi:hypothetical protein